MEIYMHISVHVFKEYAYIYILDMTLVFDDYNGLGVFWVLFFVFFSFHAASFYVMFWNPF